MFCTLNKAPQPSGRFLAAAALALTLWLAGSARAMLNVVPTLVPLEGSPGTQQRFTVSVANGGQDMLSCEMRAEHFAMSEDGLPHGAPDAGPRSAAGWLSFTPARFALAPGKAQQVQCRLSFPRDAAGGYYAIAAARGVPPRGATRAGDPAIHFSYQANIVVMAVAKSTRLRPQLALPAIELAPEQQDQPGAARLWRVRVKVANVGNVHAWAQGEADVRDRAGRRMWRGPLRGGKGLTVPGFPRFFQSTQGIALPDGDYVVGADVRVVGSRISVRGAQGFHVAGDKAVAAGGDQGLAWARTGGIVVSPGAILISGAPGSRRTESVLVRNAGTSRVAYAVSVAGWRVSEDGMAGPCPPDQAPGSAASWIAVEPASFDLPPNAAVRLRIAATIPRGPAGEHYASVLLTPRSEQQAHLAPEHVVVTVLPQGTEKPAVAIPDLGIKPAADAGYRLWLSVRNDGNVRVLPKATAVVLNARGVRVGEPVTLEGADSPLFPGIRRTLAADWPRALAPGKYTLSATVSLQGEKREATRSVPFSVPLRSK